MRPIAALILAFVASSVIAQPNPPANAPRPPSPEQMQQLMQAQIEVQLAAAARPETAERIAAFKRNLYEALLKKGFTQQQAVEITVATPLPGSSGSGK